VGFEVMNPDRNGLDNTIYRMGHRENVAAPLYPVLPRVPRDLISGLSSFSFCFVVFVYFVVKKSESEWTG